MSDADAGRPSYEELAALVVGLTGELTRASEELAQATGELARARARIAELEARLGKDSTNSSSPPSQDSPAAKGKRRAQRSQRVRSKDRKPGGQPGHAGSGLMPAAVPDRTETAAGPEQCRGCGAELTDAGSAGMSWCQIWDIPPVRLETVHWWLPKRRCGCCRKLTTASVPFGQAGAVTYGLGVNAAAVLLGSAGNVPTERTAMLMEALLGTRVSTGFVARAHERLAEALDAAGFDVAMRDALAAEPVLCGDETPVNVAHRDIDEQGQPVPGSPHVVSVRTPEARLVWYRALPARTKRALRTLGLFGPGLDQQPDQPDQPDPLDLLDLPDPGPGGWFTGYLVRDDYTAWHQFDPQLAGVQQCIAHVFRHCQAVLDIHPTQQGWAGKVRDILREANAAVQAAQADGADHLDPTLLADLRDRYDKAVTWGQATNRHRDWAKGNHPGYNLAHRLATKTDQVWLFTKVFAVPWTNNASEQALKSPKLHQKVSGYWHTLTTLTRYCRVQSYLTSATNHGLRAIDAIHAALTGNPWLPTTA